MENRLDAQRAAELLQLPVAEIRRLVVAQELPHVMVGPFVRFDREALIRWRETNKRTIPRHHIDLTLQEPAGTPADISEATSALHDVSDHAHADPRP